MKFTRHHGGKALKSKSTVVHQNGTTCKIDCKFHFPCHAIADGQQLEVSHFNPTHNHPISETACRHHIKNRTISKSVESEIAEHLNFKPSRKYLRGFLCAKDWEENSQEGYSQRDKSIKSRWKLDS